MQKLEDINITPVVAESVEEKEIITESVADTVVESVESVFQSSIARSLAEEFGYELDEADPNDPNNTAALAGQQKAMQDARAKKDGATNYTSGLDTKPAAAPAAGGQAASPTAAPAAAPAGATNPWEGKDPAKAAAWAKLTPEDQKWLGMADPTDTIILNRAPNKGKPAPQKVDPNQADRDDAEMGAAMRANAAGGNSTSAATGVGNPGEEAAATAAAGAAADKALASGTPDPKKLARYKELIAKAKGEKRTPDEVKASADLGNFTGEGVDHFLNKLRLLEASALTPEEQKELDALHKELAGFGGVDPDVTAAVDDYKSISAGGAAASPAKPDATKKPGASAYKADPIGQSIAAQLKMTTPDAIKLFQKNNGLAADGQIGPQTTKALQAAAQKMGLTVASGVGTSTAGGGRGGQGGPTATQMAQAPAASGQAASPAADPKVAQIDAQLEKYKKYPQSNAQIIARLEKEKAALGGTSATPDQQAFAKSLGGAMEESLVTQDDAILAMIRTIRV